MSASCSSSSSSSSELDASWKTALNSKRQGSFMFPEDVVVEELLAHIENTWSALWEGRPKSPKANQEFTKDCTPYTAFAPMASSEKKTLWDIVRRVLRLTKKPQEDDVLEERSDQWNCLMPRFPSGMDWYNECRSEAL